MGVGAVIWGDALAIPSYFGRFLTYYSANSEKLNMNKNNNLPIKLTAQDISDEHIPI